MNDIADVVVEDCPQPEEFELFLRRGYNPIRTDASSQESYLRFHEPETGVVLGSEAAFEEGVNEENEVIHGKSYSGVLPSKKAENTGYPVTAIYSNPLISFEWRCLPDDPLISPEISLIRGLNSLIPDLK
ncbi:MAG: hypothetical protein ABL958_18740, partial [Bdellovibrionia bacterium]